MYINKVIIKNIRSVEHFEMVFEEGRQAGWHVLIGENGAGKSTIVRSIALGIIGPYDSKSLRLNLSEWKRSDSSEESTITLTVQKSDDDGYTGNSRPLKSPFEAKLSIKTESIRNILFLEGSDNRAKKYIWSNTYGWFSSAFGPFRRFTGGEKDWMKVYYSDPRAASHLSVFGEDVALTEAVDWLKELNYKRLEKTISGEGDPDTETDLLTYLKSFLNDGGLLPHGTVLKDITSEGVLFTDGNGYDVDVTQLSDGFRSLLSLTFELLRQLVRSYGPEKVFENFDQSRQIRLPGVVLIDEVDAHLHPTWQTRIGKWFTDCFPNIQFIVTTHSPLVCRASEKGSIWYLAAPGSDDRSTKIEGEERQRLIFGDVLDAYSTETFGKNVTQSESGQEKAREIAALNLKSFRGEISPDEKQRLNELKSIMPTASL